MSAADKQKLDNIPTLTTSGDGTKYLSDNGTYKTIETPDLSNYLTEDDKTELETEIGDLSENVNGQITELQKKDSTIEGNIASIQQSISNLETNTEHIVTQNGVIPESADLDNYTTPGYYKVQSGTSDGPTNLPTSGYKFGTLIVVNPNDTEENRVSQIYIPHNDTQYVLWVRTRNSSTWNDWKPSITETRIQNLIDTSVEALEGKYLIKITSITQSAYDELQDKNANTLYIITE